MFACALAPVVAVIVTRVGRSTFPMEDPASIDLLVRDVFGGHVPLVGAYSRGFNHPGPVLFWLLAPLSALSGGAPWATLVGGAIFQGVAIGLTGWLALRRGGVALLLVVLATVGLAYTSFPDQNVFLETWNPYLAFPLFFLFLLQAWAWAEGSRLQLLGIVVTGSVLVQLHIGYLPLVGAAALWALLTLLVDRRRDPDPDPDADTDRDEPDPGARRRTWPVVASAVALVLLWVPTLVQELTGDPGNLGEIWRFFTSGDPSIGLGTAARVLAVEFRPLPPWLFGTEDLAFIAGTAGQASAGWLLVPAALLAAGFIAARHSGSRTDRHLVELAAVNTVVALFALSRVSVELMPYLFYWRVTTAVFVVLAAGWAVAHALHVREHATASMLVGGVLIVVIALGFGARTLDVLGHDSDVTPLESSGRAAMAQVTERGLPDAPILVRPLGETLGGFHQGIVDALDRSGADVRVDERDAYHYGFHRGAQPDEVAEVWYVAQAGYPATELADLPGARRRAFVTPLTKQEDAELVGLQRSLAAQLRAMERPDLLALLDGPFLAEQLAAATSGLDQAAVDRVTELNLRVLRSGECRCSIVSFPAAQAPALTG